MSPESICRVEAPFEMSISVLIVSYRVRDLLERCVASLVGAAQIIVVDNASDDASAAMVRERFPHVDVLAWTENRGFAVAVNAAAARARCDKLLVLNPDTELAPGVLAHMEHALDEAGEDVWAMGFRQVDRDGAFQLAIGPDPSLVAELWRMVLQRRLDAGDRWLGRLIDRWLGRARDVSWVGGSALLVRRQAFVSVGGFDEGFFLYFEDADLCLRLRAAGGRVVYQPSVTLVHHGGASAAGNRAQARRAYRLSQRRYWQKHRGRCTSVIIDAYQRLRGVAP